MQKKTNINLKEYVKEALRIGIVEEEFLTAEKNVENVRNITSKDNAEKDTALQTR